MNKKSVVLLDIDYTLFDTKTFKDSQLTKYTLYDEVFGILDKLSRVAELGIFSKGGIELQNAKLQKTDMKKFFKDHNIHIFEDKDMNLKNVLEKYKKRTLFLVDDRLMTLSNAKLNTPSVFTVWVKRGPFAEKQQPIKNFSPDAIINNLSELDKIVESGELMTCVECK